MDTNLRSNTGVAPLNVKSWRRNNAEPDAGGAAPPNAPGPTRGPGPTSVQETPACLACLSKESAWFQVLHDMHRLPCMMCMSLHVFDVVCVVFVSRTHTHTHIQVPRNDIINTHTHTHTHTGMHAHTRTPTHTYLLENGGVGVMPHGFQAS